MFTVDLDTFRTQQRELHREAARYRLVKSVAYVQTRKSSKAFGADRQAEAPLRSLTVQPRAAR